MGDSGCEFLAEKLPRVKRENNIDITIVNGENSAEGNGVTRHSAESILHAGADIITTGNHAFRRREVSALYEEPWIIRPANYPAGGVPGRGVEVLDMGTYRAAVINLMGTVFMDPLDNPFAKADEIIAELDTPVVFLDFHAEATSEKRAMGEYLSGRVTGVFGTHTHIQTADEQILSGQTAYITDVGMTGVENSCLGKNAAQAAERLRYRTYIRLEEAKGACFMCGIIVAFDEKSGKSHKIQRLIIR